MPNLMIVLDGLEDHAYPALGDKTPYDSGKGANLVKIQQASATGRLATTPAGFEPDTQTCILTLLGVAAADIPTGRSYIEAMAIGMPVAAQPGVTVRQVGPYKSLQCVADGGHWLEGMRTFPPHNYAGRPLEELLPSGNELADRLAAFSREMLAKYRPYTVFNWAQAVPCELPAFAALHGGLTGGMVSATDAPVGGAIAMGMRCIRPETATGDIDTDLAAKAAATLELARTCDFVMLHVGGPDEATHRKNEREKADFVRKMDAELIGPILEGLPDGARVMLTCDHIALCSTSGHTADPVAFQLFEKGASLSGDLGCIPGTNAVETLLGKKAE